MGEWILAARKKIDPIFFATTPNHTTGDERKKTSSELKHSVSNPGGNGAVECPVCRPKRVFWSYNFPQHWRDVHSAKGDMPKKLKAATAISDAERSYFVTGPPQRKRKAKGGGRGASAGGGRGGSGKKQKGKKNKVRASTDGSVASGAVGSAVNLANSNA